MEECRVLATGRTAFQRVSFIRHRGRNLALRCIIFLLLHLCPSLGNGCVCPLLHEDESQGALCGSLRVFPRSLFAF